MWCFDVIPLNDTHSFLLQGKAIKESQFELFFERYTGYFRVLFRDRTLSM